MFVNMGFKSVLPEKLENYKNIYNASLNNIINNIVNSLTFSDFFLSANNPEYYIQLRVH